MSDDGSSGTSIKAEVGNSQTDYHEIGASGSQTTSNNDVLNTIHNLVQSLQQQSSTSGSSSIGGSSSSSTGTTDQNQSTTGGSNSNTSGSSTTTGTSNTTGSSSTEGNSVTASDASSIALGKTIAAQALGNSVDTGATDGLVGNIIRQAAISFAPTRVASNNTGSYNSTSVKLLADNAAALATGTAAGAVLNYQTAQQEIANSAVKNLQDATKTSNNLQNSITGQNTNTSQNTNSTQNTTGTNYSNTGTTGSNTSNTDTSNNSQTGSRTDTGTSGQTTTDSSIQTLSKLLQTVFSNSQTSGSSSTSKESGSASFGISIVCTELMIQGKMDRKVWARGMRRFQFYPEYGKQGYFIWARPCVRELQQHPLSWKSKLLAKLFLARAAGFIPARCFVTFTSFLLGLFWLVFLKRSHDALCAQVTYD